MNNTNGPQLNNNQQMSRNELRNDTLRNDLRNHAQANRPFTRDLEDINATPLQSREKTRNIIQAISEIQRFHVIESKTDLPKDFFALEQVLDFFKIGFFSGLIEGTIFAIIVAALQAFYPTSKEFFYNEQITHTEILILNCLSYSTIAVTTFFMLFLSKYYQGVFTKRAIFSLLNGRSFSFFLKAALFFYGFLFLYNYSLKNIESTCSTLSFINRFFISPFVKISDEMFFEYYYRYIVDKILIMSSELAMIMLITALIPYITIFYKGFKERLRKYQIEEEYNKY